MGKLANAMHPLKRDGAIAFWGRLKRSIILNSIDLLSRQIAKDTSQDPYYLNFNSFVREVNKLHNHKILEIGSRNVSGSSYKPVFQGYDEYVGFDIYNGENVDVVGDVHQLSEYFAPEHFDVVLAVSVFEHLAMPWKAVMEINKVMKVNGLVFIATHPTWPAHELPWDFWRFSKEAFKVLLNPITGFEIINCVEGLPCSIIPFGNEHSVRGLHKHPANLAVDALAKKCGAFDDRLAWEVRIDEILGTMYPKRLP